MNPNKTDPKTDAKADTPTQAMPQTSVFAVTKEFWLGEKRCAEGATVSLTDSQATRLQGSVQAGAAA
jgi:hypothetical protein